MAAAPVASVVIPTRDRVDHLVECLNALEVQTAPSFEVIVVDDASHDTASYDTASYDTASYDTASYDTAKLAAVISAFPRARLVRGRGNGPAAARNLGAAAALGAVVCFTDDDCRPSQRWIEALLQEFAHGADAVAGRTLSARQDPYAEASQTITNHLMDASADGEGNVAFAPTCNVACRADVFRTVPFDESYPLAAGEDREWCARLRERGVALVFTPEARVLHDQRLSLSRFWKQQERYGRGASKWHRSRHRGERLQPARFYGELIAKGFGKGPSVGTLVALAQVATLVGVTLEMWEGRPRQRARSGSPAM